MCHENCRERGKGREAGRARMERGRSANIARWRVCSVAGEFVHGGRLVVLETLVGSHRPPAPARDLADWVWLGATPATGDAWMDRPVHGVIFARHSFVPEGEGVERPMIAYGPGATGAQSTGRGRDPVTDQARMRRESARSLGSKDRCGRWQSSNAPALILPCAMHAGMPIVGWIGSEAARRQVGAASPRPTRASPEAPFMYDVDVRVPPHMPDVQARYIKYTHFCFRVSLCAGLLSI